MSAITAKPDCCCWRNEMRLDVRYLR